MARRKQPAVAEEEEVLAFWTAVMRGELLSEGEAPAISERCKAAEMLGRHYRLFEDRAAAVPDSGAAQAVKEAMEQLRERHAG